MLCLFVYPDNLLDYLKSPLFSIIIIIIARWKNKGLMESTTKTNKRSSDAKEKNSVSLKTAEEQLYVGTAESEHIEMYLKTIWYIREQGEEVKVRSIAKVLNIRQPSVVEMLQKLNDSTLVRYQKGSLVQLTIEGNRIGKQMIRNTQLLEV